MGVPTFEESDVGWCAEEKAPDGSLRPTPMPQKQIPRGDMGARFIRGVLYAAPISAFLWALVALSVWLFLGD
jgi:hypothetical protein